MEIQCMGDRDVPELIALYDEYLNSGFLDKETVESSLHRGDYYGFRAVSGDRTLGIFTAVRGIALTCPHPALEEEIQEALGGEEIFTCDALLVLPGCREKGVGRSLALH